MKAKAHLVVRAMADSDKPNKVMIFGVAHVQGDIKWCDDDQEELWECDVILIPKKKRFDLVGTGKGDDPNDILYSCFGVDEAWAKEQPCDYNAEKVKAMMQCL